MGAHKQVPLFPLLRKVLFPGIPFHCAVVHPLEQDIVFDSIRGRKFLGVFPVGSPGGFQDPNGAVCLARIRRVHSLPDGGLLLDLLGIARAQIRAELPRGKPYRCVQIEVLTVPYQHASPPEGWLFEAHQTICSLREQSKAGPDPFPGSLWFDMVCHFLPIPFDAKVQLLRERCQQRRYQMLASYGPYWKKEKLMRKYLPCLYCCN
ncbi:LON peptidase substrate-binding domain-containing protein [bacterium]|nr:LON peptidase substrate-binding domain-containing protein [bacterium]